MTLPNMGLDLPVIAVDEGTVWAQKINDALTLIDSHDHAASGKTLTNASLSILETLDLGFQKIEKAASLSFDANATPSSLNRSLYQSSGNLFYKDHNGVAIQLTAGGAINVGGLGAITGMDATSSLSYSTSLKTFAFSQSSGVVAKIASGSISISHESSAAPAVTLKTSISSSAYDLTFDTSPPTSTSILAFSSAAQIKYKTLQGTANQISITANTNDFTFSLPSTLSIGTSLSVPTISATTGNITTVNSTTGNITTVNATTLAGTLSTAAQPNITSTGALTAPSFSTSGGITAATASIGTITASTGISWSGTGTLKRVLISFTCDGTSLTYVAAHGISNACSSNRIRSIVGVKYQQSNTAARALGYLNPNMSSEITASDTAITVIWRGTPAPAAGEQVYLTIEYV